MKKFNLLIPIAGKAQRFIDAGFTTPKPLIMVNGSHIIDLSLSSINYENCNLIFIIRQDHIYNFSLDQILRKKFGNEITIVVVDQVTEGALCTCLLAKSYIDNDLPMFVYTPDVIFENQFCPNTVDPSLDGFLLSFKANSPAHSYLQEDSDGFIKKTAEKEVISDYAAVGVYWFKTGKLFIKYAEEMIEKELKTKNEYYICPMYNLLIRDNLKIAQRLVQKMHVLGTPEDLSFYITNTIKQFGQKPIAICSDHSGYQLKEHCLEILEELNLPYINFGCYSENNCDYPDFVREAVRSIDQHECDFLIGFCRTGQGISIAANKCKGIRAAIVWNSELAKLAIQHNCANAISVPSKYVDKEGLREIILSLLESSFDGGRHTTRLMKVE